jgi:hypothetical protein
MNGLNPSQRKLRLMYILLMAGFGLPLLFFGLIK